VEDVSSRNRSATGAAQESVAVRTVPDRGSATAPTQPPLDEALTPGSDVPEEVAAFPWWHPAEAPGALADDGRGRDESEEGEEPSFEPLAATPSGVPRPRRPEAPKPPPSAVLTTVPKAQPPADPRRHLGSSQEAPFQPRFAVAESEPRKPPPRTSDEILLLDTPVAPGLSLEPPFQTLRTSLIPAAAPVLSRALAPAAARPARTFWSHAVSAVLIFIVICSVGAIYAVGYLGLGADLKAALVGHSVSPSAAAASASSRMTSEGGAAVHAPPSAIVAIPPAPVAPGAATSPAEIATSSTPRGSKAPDPPPLPETVTSPRAVAEWPLPPAAIPSGVRTARPLHSTRAPGPENRPPAAPPEPASILPPPEDPVDRVGRAALPASSASVAPPTAILPISEASPARLAGSADVPVAAASAPLSADEIVPPPVPMPPAAPFREVSPAPAVPAPGEAPVSGPSAPWSGALMPTAAPKSRPMIVLPLPSASALPSDARPSDRATAVGAVAAEIDPAVLARRGRELLAVGDIVAARRFFERAAEAGNAPAATGAGRTYDPLYLRQVARGLRGDPDKAADWYLKAVALGDSEAGVLLMRLLAARTP
jgi:hypothetical protein